MDFLSGAVSIVALQRTVNGAQRFLHVYGDAERGRGPTPRVECGRAALPTRQTLLNLFDQAHSMNKRQLVVTGDPEHPLVARARGLVVDGRPPLETLAALKAAGPRPLAFFVDALSNRAPSAPPLPAELRRAGVLTNEDVFRLVRVSIACLQRQFSGLYGALDDREMRSLVHIRRSEFESARAAAQLAASSGPDGDLVDCFCRMYAEALGPLFAAVLVSTAYEFDADVVQLLTAHRFVPFVHAFVTNHDTLAKRRGGDHGAPGWHTLIRVVQGR